MEQLKIIEQHVEINPVYSQKWFVKRGKKLFAKIYKRGEKRYSVEIQNSVTWEKNSLIECIDQVNEMAGLIFFERVIFCKLQK